MTTRVVRRKDQSPVLIVALTRDTFRHKDSMAQSVTFVLASIRTGPRTKEGPQKEEDRGARR